MGEGRYLIDELCERSGYTRRTIRFYIQSGLLEPPAGRGRGGFYSDEHLQRLRHIKRLQEGGLTLESIRVTLASGASRDTPRPAAAAVAEAPARRSVWGRYEIAPGVEVHVTREVEERHAGQIGQIVRFGREVMERGDEEWSNRTD